MRAVCRTFGTSLPTIGPGISAFKTCIERSQTVGMSAMTKTSTPIPPTQCVKERQKSTPLGRLSISRRIDAPVVVKPLAVSKKASI